MAKGKPQTYPLPAPGQIERHQILALDMSLTGAGFAGASPAGVSLSGVSAPPASIGLSTRRLMWHRDRVLERVGAGPDRVRLAVIEGYAFAQADRAHGIGELGGVIRVALYEAGVFIAIVQPGSLKAYATGNGNAKKDQMLAEAVRRLGYAGHSHDEADALWLQQMAFDAYGLAAIELPKAQRAYLERVRWPDVRRQATT